VPLQRFLGLAAAVLAAACASGRDASPAPAVGGTLVVVSPGEPDVLLPPVTTTTTALTVADRIFSRLAEIGPGLDPADEAGFRPSLAARWERRDDTTLVFHLDPRARWHDGRQVTADDVVFSFEVFRDTLVNSPLRPNLNEVSAVEREQNLSVAFRFRRAYPEQLYDATYHLRILPKHLLDTIPGDRLASSSLARAPVGSGAFRFVRWRQGTEIVLEADTAHFLGRPRLDRLVWRIVPDVSAAVSMLIAGDADAIEIIPQRDQIERAAMAPHLRLVPYASPYLAGILFNLRSTRGVGPHPLFADRSLRRALAMAVDRETVVRSVFGTYGEVPVGAASPAQWIAHEPVRQLPYDTASAARLLDELGWRRTRPGGIRGRDGRPLRFTLLVPTTSRVRQQAATIVQAQLRALGVEMRIEPVEFALFERRTTEGEFDAAFFSRTLDPSPANLKVFWSRSGIGANNSGAYASASFDSLVAAAIAAATRQEAAPLWRAALETLNEDAPAIFVYAPRNHAAVHRRFEEVSIRPDDWLNSVAEWRVAPDRRLPRDAAAPAVGGG
jgi:peptide/nickel transport system substrate-binding protein